MNAVMTGDFQQKIRSLQTAVAIHGGDLTINASGVYLSKEGGTTLTLLQAARQLSDSTQRYYDDGGI